MGNIDYVIDELEKIIHWSAAHKSRLGYFAVLYKHITIRVKEGIDNGEFENNPQMEKLDVIFAQRYLDAFHKHRAGELPETDPWHYVFGLAGRKLTIVQHLLLSINVHINYDLAISCVDLDPDGKILAVCSDYFKLNGILSSKIQDVEKGIFKLSPVLSVLARLVPKLERKLLNFSLTVARSKSWECACRQTVAGAARQAIIDESGTGVTKLSGKIFNPGIFANLAVILISLSEWFSIRRTIQVFDRILTDETNQRIRISRRKGLTHA
jgi:hypothetical protein